MSDIHSDHHYPTYCKKCGKEFYPTPEHVYRDRSGSYCSWTCFNHRNDKKVQARYEAVEQLTTDGHYIQTFQSANNAMERMGYPKQNGPIFRQACLTGGEYRGFKWRYKTTNT